MSEEKVVSPSRTYVAICNTGNFDRHYCRKFTLPAGQQNNASQASWYFLNRLDFVACVDSVITFESYSDLKEAKR